MTWIRYVAYGLLMGGADIIPGVSGGTMALIVGVYERLVGAISSLVSLGVAVVRVDIEAARTHWDAVPWTLVFPLGAGIVGAIVAGANVIPDLMDAYPFRMRGLFLGLVAASLVVPALRMETFTWRHGVLAVGFAVLAFVITGLPVFEASSPSLPRVFGSAAVAICAMILPGISGAFLLEALGIYSPTLEALRGLHLAYVATFCAGAATGLGLFAKLLDWLLKHRHDATMAALIGVIAGALRALWPYGGPERVLRLPAPGEPIGVVVVSTLAGFASVMLLLWWSHRSSPEQIEA